MGQFWCLPETSHLQFVLFTLFTTDICQLGSLSNFSSLVYPHSVVMLKKTLLFSMFLSYSLCPNTALHLPHDSTYWPDDSMIHMQLLLCCAQFSTTDFQEAASETQRVADFVRCAEVTVMWIFCLTQHWICTKSYKWVSLKNICLKQVGWFQ